MSDVSEWSATAGSNNAASPDGFPENMAPSGVNNAAREVMASVRSYYAAPEWRKFGEATGETPTGDEHTVAYASATTFTTAAGDGDTTAIYHADRRVRAVGTATTTIYGTITSSTHGAQTTVTVVWDSGTFANDANLVISLGPAADTRYTRPLESGTVQATTSGTAFDFTIPLWAKRISVLLDSVGVTGSDNLLVQIGDSGGVETSDYASISTASAQGTSTAGFIIKKASAARGVSGICTIALVTGTSWVSTHSACEEFGGAAATRIRGSGSKELSGALTTVRITRDGTDTFNLGQVNVIYE